MSYKILPIPGFSDLYKINKSGEIKSRWKNTRRATVGPEWKKINHHFNDKSNVVELTDIFGEKKKFSVAYLILVTFSDRPKNYKSLEAVKKAGAGSELHLNNLKWADKTEKVRIAIKNGTFPVGEKSKKSKLTRKQAEEIIQFVWFGDQVSYTEIAENYPVDWHAVRAIALGEKWKHLERPKGPKEKYVFRDCEYCGKPFKVERFKKGHVKKHCSKKHYRKSYNKKRKQQHERKRKTVFREIK